MNIWIENLGLELLTGTVYPDPTRNGPVQFDFGYDHITQWVTASNTRGYWVGSGYYPKPDRVPI